MNMNMMVSLAVFTVLASVAIAVQITNSEDDGYMAGPLAGFRAQNKFGPRIAARFIRPSNAPSAPFSDCRTARKALSNAKKAAIVAKAVLQARQGHLERKNAQVASFSRVYMKASDRAQAIHQEGQNVNDRIAAEKAAVAEINVIPWKARSAAQRALRNKLIRRIRSLETRAIKLKGEWKKEEDESMSAKKKLDVVEGEVEIAKKRTNRANRELKRALVAQSRAGRALKSCSLNH